MKNSQALNYGIVGLGIMGGSIAKALRDNVLCAADATGKLFACDINQDSLKSAEEQGIIDRGISYKDSRMMLSLCDFVFICLYPHATVKFLRENRSCFKDDSIVTDISGVKNLIEKEYASLCPPNADLILGHPMAGGEKEGFAHSNGAFFKNHNYIIVPHKNNKPENLEFFRALVTQLGFSKITETDSSTHDDKIGFTSQLCHVVASAMVLSARDERVTSFGGGSFEDLTRIAMINAPLWTELFLSNKEKLVAHIEAFKSQMEVFEDLIKNDNSEALISLLTDVRSKREAMAANQRAK